MAWKKVLVEDANITVGTITATLGAGTDLSSGNLSANLVVSSTDGATEGALSVAEVTFGTAAFSNAGDFLTGNETITLSGDVSGSGTTSIPVTIANNAVETLMIADDQVTFAKMQNIGASTVIGNMSGSTGSPAAINVLDEDNMVSDSATSLATQQSIKAYVDAAVAGAPDDDTTYTISTITDGATSYVGIRITGSDTSTDEVYINDQAGGSPIVVSESSDIISFGLETATNATNGVLRTHMQHTSGNNRVLGKMGAAGAIGEVLVRDEDNMTSNSDTSLATQQSIKAYVDNSISGITIPTNYLVNDADDSTSGTVTAAGFKAPSLGVTAASGSNQAGTGLTISGGQGTGTGAGGSITFQVADGGTSGSTANTLVTAMTIADDKTVTVDGDLVVNGTTTTVNAENVLFEDHFIALNNNAGTPANADSGIVFQLASDAAAFGFDQSAGRFAFDFTGATANQTTITSDAFVAAVVTTNDANYQKNGNIKIESSEIYIFVE